MEFAISNLVDRCFRASSQNPRQKSHTFFPALYRSLQNPINIFLGTQRNQTHFLYILIEPNPSLQNRNRSIPSSLLSGFTNSIEPFLSFNRSTYEIYRFRLEKGCYFRWVQEQPPKTSSLSVDQPLLLASSSVCFGSISFVSFDGFCGFSRNLD